jgi:hypothetical protein
MRLSSNEPPRGPAAERRSGRFPVDRAVRTPRPRAGRAARWLGLFWIAAGCDDPTRPAEGPSPIAFVEIDDARPPVPPPVTPLAAVVESAGLVGGELDPKLDFDLAVARGTAPFQPSRAALDARQARLEALLGRCAGGRAASAVVQLTLAGSTGRSVTTRVSTPLWPEVGRCLEDAIATEQFPRFMRDRELVTYRISSRPRSRGLPEGWLL